MISRFTVLLLLAFMSIGAQAQGNWTAWVYAASTGEVTRVSAQGEIIDAYRLPLSPAFNAYGMHALASANGRFIAYTTADTITGGGNQQLIVYDTQVGIIRFTYDLTGVAANDISFVRFPHSTAFDEAASTFSFGLLRGDSWELVVANLATESLSGGAPLDASDLNLENQRVLPIPEIVRGNAVRFFLVPADGTTFREHAAYLWTPGQTVVEVGASSAYSDVLPSSGEIAVPVHEKALLMGDATNPAGLAYNAVDIVQNGRTRLIQDRSLTISQVWWIDGGRQLLLAGFDTAMNADVLKLYNRDGVTVGQFAGQLDDIQGTPDGFVGLFPSGSGAGLAYINTAGETLSPVTLWTTSDATARLIHVQQ